MSHANDLPLRGSLLKAAIGLAAMAGALASTSAHAEFLEHYWERHLSNLSRAWCAYYSGASSSVECSFDTFAQCRVAVSGVGGFCSPNANYVAVVEPPPYRGRPHHRRHEPRW